MPPKKKGSGKGKGKKKKTSKADRERAQLEQATTQLRRSKDAYQDFCRRADRWLLAKEKILIELLRKIDFDQEGVVSFEEFKSVLYDMKVPFTAVEIHLMCKLLGREVVHNADTEAIYVSEELAYAELTQGLKPIRLKENVHSDEVVNPVLPLTQPVSTLQHCSNCKLALWDGENFKKEIHRYFEVSFRMNTFDTLKSYTGHFSQVIPSHLLGKSIEEIIRAKTHLPAKDIIICREKPYKEPKFLEASKTLEEYGYIGGTIDEPTKVVLYYDFRAKFPLCPVLTCDHYFSKGKIRKLHPPKSERLEKERKEQERIKLQRS